MMGGGSVLLQCFLGLLVDPDHTLALSNFIFLWRRGTVVHIRNFQQT